MKDIEGYEGRYAVTREGKVWSYPKEWIGNKGAMHRHEGIWLTPTKLSNQYLTVSLRKTKTTKVYIHRLVAQAYLPNPQNLPEVNHKNAVRHDNRVENLEWVNHAGNMKHAGDFGLMPRGERQWKSKLTEFKVRAIRADGRTDRESLMTLGKRYGIHTTTVRDIIMRRHWKHVE